MRSDGFVSSNYASLKKVDLIPIQRWPAPSLKKSLACAVYLRSQTFFPVLQFLFREKSDTLFESCSRAQHILKQLIQQRRSLKSYTVHKP